MKIKKVLSHNVVIAHDTLGRECVAIGKGIAFGAHSGNDLNRDRIEKTFYPRECGTAKRLSEIIDSFSYDYFRVGDEIVNKGTCYLGRRLNDSIYLALIEHLSCAIERFNNDIAFTSMLTLEMQQFYPDEFAVGLEALEIIEKRLSIRLPDDEAAFIAFHLVNACTKDSKPAAVKESLKLLRGILDIVREVYGIEYKQNSPDYRAFVRRLRQYSLTFLAVPAAANLPAGPPPATIGGHKATRTCLSRITTMMRADFVRQPSREQMESLTQILRTFIATQKAER